MDYHENECVYNGSDTYRDGVSYSLVGQDPTDVHRQRSMGNSTPAPRFWLCKQLLSLTIGLGCCLLWAYSECQKENRKLKLMEEDSQVAFLQLSHGSVCCNLDNYFPCLAPSSLERLTQLLPSKAQRHKALLQVSLGVWPLHWLRMEAAQILK